ncbi:hypothetical protein JVT61DRAFT_8061 [Boletus reticuloceps]|uniref:GATA-type domain-containing protein n=1 Tax=Boletus reticuloceps TaxID=495285 RepID=A0A8I3A6Q5_9AGAM|nr:hypothetical protein JVT61DRAFT_8061 [Boletus reticuloceps]
MASSHAHHAHPHRYPIPNPNSISNTHPQPHVPNSDFRLPPLKSLNFQYRSPQQHDAPPAQDQPSYTAFDVTQDVNGAAPAHPTGTPSAPTTNGASFSAFGYSTPTPTSATSAPAYLHRQPFAFQGQTSSQTQQQHDHDTWQQQHPHGANPPTSTHPQTPSQVHAQVPASQTSSFARTTPLVPTTVDPAPPRVPAPPPKHRSTYPPPTTYTPNTSHSYTTSYHPSSTSASASYNTSYNTSPGYTTNTASPTFAPSTSPSYASPSANTTPSYPSHNAYPTPTSAYPHPPPSPTPTPTQPPQSHPHAHTPPHYVPPPTSASAYAFDDTRSSPAYGSQAPALPVRGHPQVQDTRDSRVPIPDRARYLHTQPKLTDARIDSRYEVYPHPHPTAPTSVPASAAVDARHSQSYSQHEARPAYPHQGDSSRPGTSYAQGQPPAQVPPQTQSEVARSYPPESRTTAYTQDKYTYPQSHAPEPSTRAGTGYAQDAPTRLGYPPGGPTRPPHTHDSRPAYPHGQEPHGTNKRTPPYVSEPRQSTGYVSTQDTRHGYAASEESALPSSYVQAEQRHGPPAPPQYVPSNADQRSSFGDSRSAVPVPLARPPPPASQHHLARQSGQPHGYSPTLTSYPQHTTSNYNGSPASAPSTVPSQPQSYISPPQPAPHPSHSTHLSQTSPGHPPAQTVHSAHPTQTQTQPSHTLSHSQAQQQMHHPEASRPTFVSPADTMHARETRFPMNTIAEEERERQRERERERESEREKERERERELEREHEREKQRERERESQREREKERERLAELREKEQRERERDREREGIMHEVLKHCTVLYNFAIRYAQLQSSTPLVQPSTEELAEMTHRAQEVVRLLESLRSPSSGKLANASTASSSLSTLAPASAPHPSITTPAFGDRMNSHAALNASGPLSGAPIDLDTRAPKRPWEETQTSSQGGGQTAAERSAAEKDMEIIRTKRALTTSLAAAAAAAGGAGSVAGAVGGAVGAGKSKYRKRSRAIPPGKCHSCNIRETPEWRRGPDGARTLCNACGLHYAKLVRKRDKALAAEGGSGTVMRIDMEMLRASARAAENEKAARAAANGTSTAGCAGSGSNGDEDMDKMSVHTGSFQILPMSMNMDSESGPGQGRQGTPKTQTQTHAQSQQPQAQPSQPSATQLHPLAGSSGTPLLHSHGVGSTQGHPLPPPHAHGPPSQGNAHYSHSSSQARTHSGPPPPPWVSKTYPQEMQHPQQSFIRTSHSVSSGASPPR